MGTEETGILTTVSGFCSNRGEGREGLYYELDVL